MYREGESSSEQVSQLIWGAPVEVLESGRQFSLVLGEDLYTGWVRSAFLTPLDDDPDSATTTIATLFGEVYWQPSASSELITRLTTGSRIVLSRKQTISGFIPIDLPDGGNGYVHETQVSLSYSSWMPPPDGGGPDKPSELGREELFRRIRQLQLDRVKHSSLLFIGVPYLWGGTTPFGMDCSGFTQLVYKISGIQLLRDASLQFADSRFDRVDSSSGLAQTNFHRSDLLFFNSVRNEPSRITHVGLALGDGRFIHSVGKGRGTIVTNCADEEFAQTFVGARRLLETGNLRIAPVDA